MVGCSFQNWDCTGNYFHDQQLLQEALNCKGDFFQVVSFTELAYALHGRSSSHAN